MAIERENLEVHAWTVGPIMTNVYVVACRKTGEAVIIDAGAESDQLVDKIEEKGWKLKEIWQTHAHIDHVAGLNEVRARSEAPILMHAADQPLYEMAVQQGAMFGFRIQPLPPVDQYVEEGQVVNVGELKAKVILLPGHSPGSVAFYFWEEGLFFGGDVLFAGSVGRVDLPGSSPVEMRRSLERVKELPDETEVLCGHGPTTTIGQEKRLNPFLRGG